MELSLGLYVITTESGLLTHIDIAKAASMGGADIVQYRDKKNSFPTKIKIGQRIRQITEQSGVKFIVNDSLEIAYQVGADGVHLGNDDASPQEAREKLGKDAIIGVSASNDEEIEYAIKNGADYLGSGPVYHTITKLDAGNPIGVSGIKEIVSKVELPVVAIGGIKLENVEELFTTGIDGIAIGSAILTDDIFKQVRRFRAAIDDCKAERTV